MKKILLSAIAVLSVTGLTAQPRQLINTTTLHQKPLILKVEDPKPEFGVLNNTKVDGFRPIWFDLGARTEYGSKYSGGLGTYTMKHRPLAIYDKETDRTYFVFGGTKDKNYKHLLCMISCYDHKTGLVKKPTVVYDKGPVNDPHDNPALLIDDKGYIWVYVAGRGNNRYGYRYRSVKPHDIDQFELMGEGSIMAYPQPYFVEGRGHFLFETRYDGVRRSFFQTSEDGIHWSEYHALANIIDKENGETKSGHYQITGHCGDKLVTAFNRHPDGKCDYRTNIYYIQTTDFGKTWTLADGTPIEVPITDKDSPCKILEVENNGQNCYIKDVNFDADGNPIILYVTSFGWRPGPEDGPRQWSVAYWNGKKWLFHDITRSTNGYDSGSLYVEGKVWTVIGPTEPGPQFWGQGGEIAAWSSRNEGKSWKKTLQYTYNSPRNNSYVRRPVDAKDPFYGFWADGNPDVFSISCLYFGDSKGHVWRLPYDMKEEWEAPEVMTYFKDNKLDK